MIKRSIVLVLLLLAGCHAPALRLPVATIDPNEGQEVLLPAEFVDGWIIVEAMINDHGPYRLILDTGAFISGLAPRIVEELGLKTAGRVNVTDIAGVTTRFPLLYAEEIAVGPLSLRPAPLIATPIFEESFSGLRVDGLLGYTGLDAFTLDLDYPDQRVRLTSARLTPHTDGAVPLRREGVGSPAVQISLHDDEGRPLQTEWFEIDSGGETHLHLLASTSDEWAHRDVARALELGSSLSGTVLREQTAPLRGPVAIGGVTIERAVAHVDTHHHLIGHRLLRLFRVRLDPRSGLAAFTLTDPAQHRVTAPQFAGIGINMQIIHDGVFTLASIAADSPAARAGLLPNDRVLAIDGVPVGDPDFVDRTGWMFDPPPEITLSVQREDEIFDLTVPTEPLFPEDLGRLRHAAPDLQPPPVQLITHPDGTMELVFPDGSGGVLTPVPPAPNPDP
ncbi:MAG: aspartyl protease family protein [Phycisphaerales bacterium]|nr:aspartyl protease family protein [Planctomycetota bacterium]MCH8509446.1 aspartyl protease family protein [Phycisphaerales bacterium]